jgi:single-strand DNA-binding protein
MGASFNHVTLLGNLVRAPELRYTPQGTAVCDLSIAINRTYTETDGTKKEEVTYVDIVCWSKFAEIAGKYLKKGSQVLISGRLHQDSWIDKNTGQKRSKIVVIAENLQMLGSRDSESGSSPTSNKPPQRQAAPVPVSAAPAPRSQLEPDWPDAPPF